MLYIEDQNRYTQSPGQTLLLKYAMICEEDLTIYFQLKYKSA